jgi:hypothetical protein
MSDELSWDPQDALEVTATIKPDFLEQLKSYTDQEWADIIDGRGYFRHLDPAVSGLEVDERRGEHADILDALRMLGADFGDRLKEGSGDSQLGAFGLQEVYEPYRVTPLGRAVLRIGSPEQCDKDEVVKAIKLVSKIVARSKIKFVKHDAQEALDWLKRAEVAVEDAINKVRRY